MIYLCNYYMIKLGRIRYVDLFFKKDFLKVGMGKNSVMFFKWVWYNEKENISFERRIMYN